MNRLVKSVPIPVENTPFKKGVSMSEQLRKEREALAKTAILRKATPGELGVPKRKGPKPGTGGRPRKELGGNYTPQVVKDAFADLIRATLELPTEQHIKVKLISAVITMQERGEL